MHIVKWGISAENQEIQNLSLALPIIIFKLWRSHFCLLEFIFLGNGSITLWR